MKFSRSRINGPLWFIWGLFAFAAALAAGWVVNIVKLFGLATAADPNYVMAALRIAGIFLAPLGGVLGWL